MSLLDNINFLSQEDFDRLPSQSEMAALDALTIRGGVPSLTLMERAGKAVLKEILNNTEISSETEICILCGPGNNGGDGLVIARLLRGQGIFANAVLCSSKRYSPECLEQIKKLKECGGKILIFPDNPSSTGEELTSISKEQLSSKLSSAAMIIDALLGTGQKDPPRGVIHEILEVLRQDIGKSLKVAVDLPTGLNGDTGEVYTPHFSADLTLCIELLKRGMCQYPGRDLCGKISLVTIDLDHSGRTEYKLLCPETLPAFPSRKAAAHKGDCGRVFVLGGSRNMPGAPVLSGSAALRTGAGLVTVAALKESRPAACPPELMFEVFDTSGNDFFDSSILKEVGQLTNKSSALVLGPGLGTAPGTGKLVEALTHFSKTPIVIDADALNLLSQSGKIAEDQVKLAAHILTPHPGEMARLLNIDTAAVQRDRYAAARQLAHLTHSVVVLKGAGTIVYFEEEGFVNPTGNPFMATAGSGDVLSGLIAALLAQGLDPLESAKLGVYLHGLAGDLASSQSGGLITASDIINYIPKAAAQAPNIKNP